MSEEMRKQFDNEKAKMLRDFPFAFAVPLKQAAHTRLLVRVV